MIFNKKKAVSVILSRMGEDGRQRETQVAHGSREPDEYSSLADSLMEAFKEGSRERLANVLKSFHAMIKDEDLDQDMGE